LKKKSKF